MKKLIFLFALVILSSFAFADYWSGEGNVFFHVSTTSPKCEIESGNSYWKTITSSGEERELSLEDCYRDDGVDSSGSPDSTCCPSSKPDCIENGDTWKCNATSNTRCEQYPESQCGNTDISALSESYAELTIAFTNTVYSCGYTEPRGDCIEMIDCQCAWNGSRCLPSGKLKVFNGTDYFDSESSVVDLDDICATTGVATGDCFLSNDRLEDCSSSDHHISFNWSKQWRSSSSAPAWCTGSGISEYPCPNYLDFFSTIGIAALTLLLTIFYFYRINKKKSK